MLINFSDWHETQINLKYLSKLIESIPLNEADYSHYSIEINYRTSKSEVLDSYAKLVLGYVSAAVKRNGYHVRHVFNDKPLRIIVATRNWDDGEWVAIISYNPSHASFFMSAGYWNKDRKTVSIYEPATKKLEVDDAAGITNKIVNYMHELKQEEPRKANTLKPALLKRGPKK